MLYIGQEVGFGSWIPSFATQVGVTDLQGADLASEIFWISNTVFRILLIYMTFKVSLRLKFLLLGMIGGSTVNLISVLTGH
jgi:fucose permease